MSDQSNNFFLKVSRVSCIGMMEYLDLKACKTEKK